ncbi:hypothetical protein ACI3L1_06640 [Deinococcus sp. SM5_A1]|uniref:hypothetical protein n=1 Tax=Deinococcus sp. SM5_A1 TaxID=3379094 RepID=UPI00385F333D
MTLPARLAIHIRFRAAHNASPDELALLGEAEAAAVERDMLKAAQNPAPPPFDFPALLRELYPDPMTRAMRRASEAFIRMAAAIGTAGAMQESERSR